MPSKVELYKCSICGRTFTNLYIAEQHEKKHKIPMLVSEPEYSIGRDEPNSVLIKFNNGDLERYYRREY